MIQEIKDIYKYCKDNNKPMLSSYDSAFWLPYVSNFAVYDRMFVKMFRSWFPMDQVGELGDISDDFAADVRSWLTINDKRYSELFRIQTLPDNEKYSLTDNVYEHEVIGKETNNSGSNVKGAETITDESENIYGLQTDTEEREKVYGEQVDDEDKSLTYGTTQKTTTNGTSAFNESGFSDTDRTVEDGNTHTDSEDNSYTHGTHTDTEENTYTRGGHTDELTNTQLRSQRTDTHTDTGTEETERTRSGNIGVMTVDQMLEIHKNVWVDFSFYKLIFEEIARELLRGCY